MEPELRELLDKQAIHEVVLRYCRGIDRLDRELVRGCYWPEATDEHGSFLGTRDEYVSWVFDRMLPRYAMTMHFVGNVLVEVHGDVAKCETYGIALHRALDERPDGRPRAEHDFQTGFRYVDDFARRDGEWRVARRICTFEWTLRTEPGAWFDPPPEHRRGERNGTDPVYWPVLGAPGEAD